MSRSSLMPQGLDANRYLRLVACVLIVLTCANLLYCALRYEIGYPPVSFLGTGPEGATDRFADLVKDTVSYRAAVSGLTPASVNKWPAIFRMYYVYPVYGGKEALADGVEITHFHQPPLTTLYFLASAAFIVRTQSAVLDILFFYTLFLAAVQWAMVVGIPPERRTAALVVFVWLAALLTYPGILVLVRGNFQSGITSMMITAFLLSVFIRKRVGWAALLSLAIAANFRPNAVIFVFAIPLMLGWKRSWKPVFAFGAFASAILAGSYFASHQLYPDYTVSTFLRGLEIYKKIYIIGPAGDAGNSSMWVLLKNFASMRIASDNPLQAFLSATALMLVAVVCGMTRVVRWTTAVPVLLLALYFQLVAFTDNQNYLPTAFTAFSLVLLAAAGWGLWRCPKRVLVAPFLLTSLYCLLTPVFADYHLLSFMAPILALYLCQDEWAEDYRLVGVMAGASALMLVTKNYVAVGGPPLQSVINPLIVYMAAMYVASEAPHLQEPAEVEGPAVDAVPALQPAEEYAMAGTPYSSRTQGEQ
jgi:hypothetical protein